MQLRLDGIRLTCQSVGSLIVNAVVIDGSAVRQRQRARSRMESFMLIQNSFQSEFAPVIGQFHGIWDA